MTVQHTLSIFSSCTYYQYILLTHSNLPYQHTLLRKVREQGISQAARERSAILERQLTIAQERLGAERGAQVLDSAMATEAAERDVALDRAVAEIENLKQRLAAAEGTILSALPILKPCSNPNPISTPLNNQVMPSSFVASVRTPSRC